MADLRRVLVVFSDDSLGGTSRSALTMGLAWREAGAVVEFAPLLGIHPDRLGDFQDVGLVQDDPEAVDPRSYELIHHHHGHVREDERSVIARWAESARHVAAPPSLLTHNVFGVPDYPVEIWPGPTAVGLLGAWLESQYRMSCWPRVPAPSVLVPNPQDFDFFRPPTRSERVAARTRFADGDRPLVLRVGSPLRDKWSNAYIALDAAAEAEGASLVCVGPPPGLARELLRRGHARLLPAANDAQRLRDLYWAADVLAVDARQGESFGNVLLEACGCGLPVVYRDRPVRDNTPREFPVTISRTGARWVRDTIDIAVGRRPAKPVEPAALKPYSVDGVGEVLRVLLDGRLSSDALAAVRRHPATGAVGDRIAIGVRHLPPGRTALRAARAVRTVTRSLLATRTRVRQA